jgi:hypothetical protein
MTSVEDAKSLIGTFETAGGRRECPFIGADQKSPAEGQDDAIDPGCVKTQKFETRRE